MNWTHSRPRVHLLATARHLAALVSILVLATGCGAAGADAQERSAQSVTPLEFTTASLPDGSTGVAYAPTAISTRGGSGDVGIQLASGTLPPGLYLTSDGRLVGTPHEPGLYEFTAEASDGEQNAARSYCIAVDHFALVVESGLRHGHAWSGRELVLRVTGTSEPVQIELATNASAGRVLRQDQEGRRMVYIPGRVEGEIVKDVIRARLLSSGAVRELSLSIAPDPMANHFARFGSTDVWMLEFGGKRGAHPYATDLQATLASVGLRSPASTDRQGTPADRMAEELLRLGVLRHLNTMFGRNADGSAGAEGLAISFTQELPESGYERPAPGQWLSGAPHRYSVMAFVDGSSHGVVGTALTDSHLNSLHMHNAPGSSGELGVFLNRVTEVVSLVYHVGTGPLVRQPLAASDLEHLEALLYGLPGGGARYQDLQYMLEGLARSLAAVAAHEVGHSLGLAHTNPTTYGSLMNSAATIHPLAEHRFIPEDLARLRQALPGPGRTTALVTGSTSAPPGLATQQMPMGGVHVCRRGECDR